MTQPSAAPLPEAFRYVYARPPWDTDALDAVGDLSLSRGFPARVDDLQLDDDTFEIRIADGGDRDEAYRAVIRSLAERGWSVLRELDPAERDREWAGSHRLATLDDEDRASLAGGGSVTFQPIAGTETTARRMAELIVRATGVWPQAASGLLEVSVRDAGEVLPVAERLARRYGWGVTDVVPWARDSWVFVGPAAEDARPHDTNLRTAGVERSSAGPSATAPARPETRGAQRPARAL